MFISWAHVYKKHKKVTKGIFFHFEKCHVTLGGGGACKNVTKCHMGEGGALKSAKKVSHIIRMALNISKNIKKSLNSKIS